MDRARRQGQLSAAQRFEQRLRDGEQNERLFNQILLSGETERDEMD
jgi:hypothetical protein